MDILGSGDNLSEYDLSEFKVLRTSRVFDKMDTVLVVDSKNNKKVIDYRYIEDFNKDVTAFIPFYQVESWHLFDYQGYYFHYPDEQERKKRLNTLISLSGGLAKEVRISSSSSFHNGIEIFGVACSSEDLERLFAIMREHRSEVSIDKIFFDKEKMKEFFLDSLQKDIDYILEREMDEYESRVRLLNNLKDHIFGFLKIDKFFLNDNLEKIFSEALYKAEYLDEKEKVDKEISKEENKLDDLEKHVSGRENSRPFRESMGRRSKA